MVFFGKSSYVSQNLELRKGKKNALVLGVTQWMVENLRLHDSAKDVRDIHKISIILKENPAITIISYTPTAAHFANGTSQYWNNFLGPPLLFQFDVRVHGRRYVDLIR